MYHDVRLSFFFSADTPLSKERRALLKWKMSSITPNVVKNCIARAGFTKCTSKKNPAILFCVKFACDYPLPLMKGGSAWLGYWGKHMKASSFRNIKEHQKANRRLLAMCNIQGNNIYYASTNRCMMHS